MDKLEYSGFGEPFFLEGTSGIGVLLLHGWTSPPDELMPLAKYLNKKGYSVYAPLLRGHGTKPEDLEGVTWEDWLEDARAAMNELKKRADKIITVGFSMGGDLAIQLSSEDSVLGMVALGAPIKFRFQPLVGIALYFMALTKKYRKKYYPFWIRKHMGARKVYSYYPTKSAVEVIKLARNTKALLSQITKPILIMQSTTDHMVSAKSPQIIYDRVKSEEKEICWVENGYHVFVENEETIEAVGDFIAKILKK